MGVAAKRREKRKAAKAQAKAAEPEKPQTKGKKKTAAAPPLDDEDVVIEYVAAPLEVDAGDEAFAELNDVFQRFSRREDGYAATYLKPEDGGGAKPDDANGVKKEEAGEELVDVKNEDGDDVDDEGEDEEAGGVSNRARKLATRMKIAELKQHCAKPEVVEVWDTTAADPRLLVYLKAYRNTIPVPQHWCQKRKFLQGKRGLEKPPWQLPAFIEATGIQKLRDAYAEKEEGKKLKQKTKDKTTAKMGKIDIDYQVLHDAFFKYQTKPKMTSVGELYYEGKEYETDLKGKKPGVLSEETRAALGMTEDGPPPWLINMQRYGPPPSYPNLKIPGLSAPIPPGAQFGYHPGGWGKPPVDEYGNPIYGDVFGVRASADDGSTPYDVVLERRKPWGALEELSVSESEDEDEEEEEESDAEEEELGEEEMAAGIATGATGVETPEAPMDLRKRSAAPDAPPQLYRVLDAREANVADGNIMGSSHVYVVPGAGGDVAGAVPGETRAKRTAAGATEIALNPEDLEAGMDDAAVAARYEAEVAARRAASAPEDFSDMVAENARKTKRKAEAKKKESDAKKFKF